jgi:hypothetical protein
MVKAGCVLHTEKKEKTSWPVDDQEIQNSDSVSPYLRRPMRSFAQACRDIMRKNVTKWQKSAANENRPIYVASVRAHFDETP